MNVHSGGRPSDPAERRARQVARNRRVRAAVARLADPRPVRLEPRAETDTVVRDGLRRTRLLFDHDGRAGVRAVLLGPDTPDPLPAVLVCPGRNARLDAVTGGEPPDYPDRDVAVHLARAGLRTLTLDYGLDRAHAAVADQGRDPATVLDGELRLHGRSLLGVLVDEARAALAWLADRPGTTRVGLAGHSLGAAVALHAALLHDAPVPVCAASHLGGYATLFGRLATWDQFAALPSVLRHADLPDLYAALAPAPLQLQYGLDDRLLDPDDAAAAGKRVRDDYAAAGAEAEVLALPMGHGTGTAEAAAFLTRALAEPAPPPPPVPPARVAFSVTDRLAVTDLVDGALASGALTLGPVGAGLEEAATGVLGRGTAVVSSGSAALEIALRIVGVAGRTVLVPANTFFATAASAVRAGARVQAVDMELDGLGMDPAALRAALDAHGDTAAVLPVHIAGVVSPALPEILALCAERGVPVVEDAAHALGSTLGGAPAGTFGRLATFSLYPTKVITAGEGGLLSADGDDLDRARRLRDHGKRSFTENLHADLGSNWRMSELHAAVGTVHLARLDAVLAERRRLAAWYDAHLADVPGLTRYTVPDGVATNHYKYLAFLPEGVDRADLKRRLRARGVGLSGEIYDTLIPEQPYFAATLSGAAVPNAAWFASRHVCLPVLPGMTEHEQRRVVEALRAELA
ncbi:DegT/DnrJ/EryC1/StrS aminotransferase family protein [Nocardiopsis trehalosi]|uniref:DegT/DnrJ/EryC1/StrS aminotransferase family protein n=1 Tax=Nocardiopsis trehalosi TaxID=109329 RepID=UPI00082B5836|nr:DegT/DnrJ/EryC1/StrS family aminotransferase [Nocardiopsis trehalosi]